MAHRNVAIEKAKELLERKVSGSLKDEIERWYESFGTDDEDYETDVLIETLEDNIMSIDEQIAYFKSAKARISFGEEQSRELLSRAETRKKAGEQFCDCAECRKIKELLSLLKTDLQTV